jgi:N-acetyl-gamma-glutamyl-phosphate reductase common form
MSNAPVPVIVLGGSGYVAGELLRLVGLHPRLSLGAAVSTSVAGEPIASSFGHLGPMLEDATFDSMASAVGRLGDAPRWIVLSAAPHGASAPLVAELLNAADAAGCRLTVVDASADFRFRSSDAYEAVYGHPHPAPELLSAFRCAVPEHAGDVDTPHAGQPGCFATAMLLAIVPLVAKQLAQPDFYVSAITGSTGAGGTPRETTHHPVRQSNVFAYQALNHRHDPEVCALAESATGAPIDLHFVPHSGPFARGIHATVFAQRANVDSSDAARAALAEYYADAPFVDVVASPPRVKDVVGTNYARLSVAVDNQAINVCCVIDNLVKGAAGGAIQWVNRLSGWPEHEGLTGVSPGWV